MATHRVILFAVSAFLCASCTREPLSTDAPLASLLIVGGTGQSGLVGTELPQPLVVRALTESGRPIRGQLVNFRVTSGGGRMFAGASLTDRDGQAQDYWTLGPTPGVQTVDVVAVDPTTGAKVVFGSFTATATLPAVPTTLLPNPLTVGVGETGMLTATLSPAPTAAGTISVSSLAPGVASVPVSVAFAVGQTSIPVPVTAVAQGSTQVTVQLNGGSASCTVQVVGASCEGREEWTLTTNAATAAAPVLSATTTYIAQGTMLYAADNVTGAIRWTWQLPPSPGANLSAPAVATIAGHEFVYQAASDGFLYKIDAANGVTEHSLDTRRKIGGTLLCPTAPGDALSSPAVQLYQFSSSAFRAALDAAGHAGDDLVIVGTRNGCGDTTRNRILGIYASDLAIRWEFNADGVLRVDAIYSACSLSYDFDRLFCGADRDGSAPADQKSLFAVESTNGQLAWSGNAGAILNRPTLAGGRVYVASKPGSLMAFAPAGDGNGNEARLWPSPVQVASAGTFVSRDLAVAAPFVFVVDNLGILTMVQDTGSGGARRSVIHAEPGVQYRSRPVVGPTIAGSSKLYIGRDDGMVQQLEWSRPGSVGFQAQGVVAVGDNPSDVYDPSFDDTGGVFRLIAVAQNRAVRLILPFCNAAPYY